MEIFEINLADSFSAGPITTTVRLLFHAQKTGEGASFPKCDKCGARHAYGPNCLKLEHFEKVKSK